LHQADKLTPQKKAKVLTNAKNLLTKIGTSYIMKEKAINYPYLAGGLQALISGLAYSLVRKGIVGYDKYDELKAYFEHELDRIKQAERNS
jgi:hypothetical protein